MPRCLVFFFLTICYQGINPADLHSQGVDHALKNLTAIHAQPSSTEKDSALAHEYNYLAEAYSGGQDSLAQIYIDSLTHLLQHTKWPKTEGLQLRAKGKYHDRRGEFELALDYYTQSIDAFRRAGDQSDYLAYTYILKAFVLSNNGLFDECEKTLNEIRPLAEKLPNKNFLAWILDWHGDQYFYSSFQQQDFAKAVKYYHEVEALLPDVRNAMIKADNAHGLAGCYMRLGQVDKALEYRDRALEIAKQNNIHAVTMAVYSDLADVLEERGDFNESLRYRNLSLEYAKQVGWIEMEARMLRNLAFGYKAAGDHEKALQFFEEFKEVEDSLSRFEVQTKYHDLEAKYESGKKDLKIQQLKAGKLQIFLYVLGVILIGGILFLDYYRRTNKKLVQHNRELQQKNVEIQMALTEGQNIERKRMAIELHDNINAKIAAAKWMLETINTPDKSEDEKHVIDRLVESMRDIYEDVRFISHNLVPKDLETKSLNEIIQQLVQNLNHNQKITFTFTTEGQEPLLDTGLKLQCYAMIMELVNNTLKHSGCQHASIQLHFSEDALRIQVEDDGKGFDPEKVESGVGLKNLATRLNAVSGKILYQTPGHGGSAIDIQVPVRYAGVS
jgi:signal transduction histidine kinase